MINLTAKPEQTFALVVGIEKYQETAWNVGGTAIDAFKFARWLRLRGVPKENIRLCLSFLDAHQDLFADGDFKIEEATEQNLFAIITDFLSSKSGDLLYIYWAGHGLINSERERRLLCADITQRNWQNIDLDSLLLFLNSDAFAIRRHICIVDACANYLLESNGRPTNLGGRVFSSGKPRTDSQQFVLLATREGEKAKVNSANKTGYFSQAVREALEQEPLGIWPPDMVRVAEKVKQQFLNLNIQQQPTYYFYQTWDGDKNCDYPHQVDIPHNIPNNIPISKAREFIGRDEELQELYQLLQQNNIVAITDLTRNGGVGKTELALQYANKYLTEYPGGCCWLYPNGVDIGTQLVEFAGVNFSNFHLPNGLSLNGQVLYCWRNWQDGKVLLVFDNVTDINQIQPYLPSLNAKFKVLITTRQSDLPFTPFPLGGMQPDKALNLLAILLGEEYVKEKRVVAEEICKLMGYVPQSLYLVAARANI